MESQTRPLLIYDGDCNFCCRWVSRWRHVTRDRVEYAVSRDVAHRFPEIPEEKFLASVILVDPQGKIFSGAEAVFRTLATAPNGGWPLKLYRTLPLFAPVSERLYRFVAEHRIAFSRLTRWCWGDSVEPPSYILARRLFLMVLCAVYFMAFASLWVQVQGLIGSEGISPAKEFLEAVGERPGRYWRFPTLFWLHVSDGSISILCIAGMVLSSIAFAGFFQASIFFLLWMIYLSFLIVGQNFMSFQWDILLLEAGFLAIFFAPVLAPAWGRWKSSGASPPNPVVLFLYRFLLFRVMFSSGAVKLASGDPSWSGMTALHFHYETQPLPTWGGWYAHQLPAGFQGFSVGVVFAIQLLLPFFIFAPRRLRFAAAAILVGFQGLIIITGNYCFFNLLTMALCLLLLDDFCLRKVLPENLTKRLGKATTAVRSSLFKRLTVAALATVILLVSISQHLVPLVFSIRPPALVQKLYRTVLPFRLVNPYGLFAVMTTARYEIIIEGSRDGRTWEPYEFKWKPGDVKRAPAFVAPHQPRLDWQMWFAALTNFQRQPWILRFMAHLLNGSGPVLDLLDHNPFPNAPPRLLRAVIYQYRFTDFSDWREDQSWWQREYKGRYTPVISLKESAD